MLSGAFTCLFRVDAGPAIGLGHVSRCLSLAAALKQVGIASIILAPPEADVRTRAMSSGHRFEAIGTDPSGTDADCEELIAKARTFGCKAVVIDSYAIGAAYLDRVRCAGFVTLVIDDLAREPFPVDIVVNGGAQAPQLRYESSRGDTRFLLGPEYALLRPEFWGRPRRRSAEQVKRILVTVGGTDAHDLTSTLVMAVDRVERNFSVTVVMGPFFTNQERIESIARTARHEIEVVRAPLSLLKIFEEADIAVSGGGQTLYELAAVGTPAMAIALIQNQVDSVKALAKAGTVASFGLAGHQLGPEFPNLLRELIDDFSMRAAMCLAGQKLVDGLGPVRVADVLRNAA